MADDSAGVFLQKVAKEALSANQGLRVRCSWSVVRCVKTTVSGFTKNPLEI